MNRRDVYIYMDKRQFLEIWGYYDRRVLRARSLL